MGIFFIPKGNLVLCLGFIYIRAKATSLLTCCIVSDLCVYATAMSERQKIKKNYPYRVRFHVVLTKLNGSFTHIAIDIDIVTKTGTSEVNGN